MATFTLTERTCINCELIEVALDIVRADTYSVFCKRGINMSTLRSLYVFRKIIFPHNAQQCNTGVTYTMPELIYNDIKKYISKNCTRQSTTCDNC